VAADQDGSVALERVPFGAHEDQAATLNAGLDSLQAGMECGVSVARSAGGGDFAKIIVNMAF